MTVNAHLQTSCERAWSSHERRNYSNIPFRLPNHSGVDDVTWANSCGGAGHDRDCPIALGCMDIRRRRPLRTGHWDRPASYSPDVVVGADPNRRRDLAISLPPFQIRASAAVFHYILPFRPFAGVHRAPKPTGSYLAGKQTKRNGPIAGIGGFAPSDYDRLCTRSRQYRR